MRRKLIHGTIAVVVGTACALPAYAQVKPEVLVKQRQSAMVLQGKYFYGHLRPTAQGKMPYDASSIARDVGYLDALSKMPCRNLQTRHGAGIEPAKNGEETVAQCEFGLPDRQQHVDRIGEAVVQGVIEPGERKRSRGACGGRRSRGGECRGLVLCHGSSGAGAAVAENLKIDVPELEPGARTLLIVTMNET